MLALGLWVILGGYTLAYWGHYLMQGQHVSMQCVALGQGC